MKTQKISLKMLHLYILGQCYWKFKNQKSNDATATCPESRSSPPNNQRSCARQRAASHVSWTEKRPASRRPAKQRPAGQEPEVYIENRHRGNTADHIQVIEHFEEEPDSHPFARCVIRGHQQIPAIIMYIDEQLQDIRRFCCSAPVRLVLAM